MKDEKSHDGAGMDLLSLGGVEAAAAWRLAHELDAQIEKYQRSSGSAERLLSGLSPWLLARLGARGLVVELLSPSDDLDAFHFEFGEDTERACRLACAGRTDTDRSVACVSLDVHGRPIGFLAAVFDDACPAGAEDELEPWIRLQVVAQELDNVLYEFSRARLRHRQVMKIEEMLRDPVLERTIDASAPYVLSQTGADCIAVLYDDDKAVVSSARCRAYDRAGLVKAMDFSDQSLPRDCGGLCDYVLEHTGLEAGEVTRVTPVGPGDESTNSQCKVVVSGSASSLDGPGMELVEHFAIALSQRLVDYHKEQRYLSHFFSPSVITRLLSHPDYFARYLSPRLRQVAMMFADIVSFTKISEQILSGPEEVAELIDYWSQGVVRIVYEHGGTFDKMVGDCVIALFGPPFDERDPAECCASAVSCAIEIDRYTRGLAGLPAIGKIRSSGLVPGLGVATGVNFGTAMVGAIGPNQDFTAFGRAMNNTARIQGVAEYGEVLILDEVKRILEEHGHELAHRLDWGEPDRRAVKNVEKPLTFYRLAFGRDRDGGGAA